MHVSVSVKEGVYVCVCEREIMKKSERASKEEKKRERKTEKEIENTERDT